MVNRTAADATELGTALADSSGGDTIELTGAQYGAYDFRGNSFASPIIIWSTNPVVPAVFSFTNAFARFDGTNNITVRDVLFQRFHQAGDDATANTIRIDDATALKFEDCVIKGGTMPDGNYNGRGVADRGNANGVTFERCLFTELFKGYTGGTDNLLFDQCEFTALRSDGMSLGAQTTVTLHRCYFHDFNTVPGSSAHPDMCQIYRNNSIGTANLTVRYCVFDDGLGRYGQGLFAGTSGEPYGGPGTPTRHTNWWIHDNVFYKDHDNVLNLSWVDGLTIHNNATIQVDASNGSDESWIRLDDTSTNINIYDNITAGVHILGVGPIPANPAPPTWTLTNNVSVLVADQAANFEFLAATNATNPAFNDVYHDYKIKAGGPAHTANVGPRIMKRDGDWGGNGISPHPNYPGGFGGSTPPPTLQTLPSGSVTFNITAP